MVGHRIRLVVEGLNILILPLINPDGREYVRLSTEDGHEWWRKNRSYNNGSRGTDINRNYDFLWKWIIGNTSDDPRDEGIMGPPRSWSLKPATSARCWMATAHHRLR